MENYSEFKETKLREYADKISDKVKSLTNEMNEEGISTSKKTSLERQILNQSAHFASLMLESYDVELMTMHPWDPEHNPVYCIVEKITPYRWVIKEKDTDNTYEIRRGKIGTFRLNGKYIYCCYPLNNH